MRRNILNRLSIVTPLTFLFTVAVLTLFLFLYWGKVIIPSFLKGEKTKAELVMIYAIEGLEKALSSGNHQAVEDVMGRLTLLKSPGSEDALILALSVNPLSGDQMLMYADKAVPFFAPFTVTSPLYSSKTLELMGDVTLQYNDIFYKRLLDGARKRMLWAMCIIAGTMIVVTLFVRWQIKPLTKLDRALREFDFNQSVQLPEIKGFIPGEITSVIAAIRDLLFSLDSARQAEMAVHDYVSSIIDSMTECLIVMTPDDRLIKTVNKATCRVLGYSEDELIGKKFDDFVVVTDEIEMQKSVEIVLSKGYLPNREGTFIHRNGKKIPVLASGAVLRDAQGNIQGMICVGNNISDLKKAQAEQARLIKIIENTSDLVGVASPDLKTTYINSAGIEMQGGKSVEDFINKDVRSFFPDWAFDIIRIEGVPTALRDGIWKGETALLRMDGDEVPISQVIISHKSSDGEIEYLSTIARDITDRVLIEQELKIHHDNLERLVAERTNELAQKNEMLQYEIEERKRIEDELLISRDAAEAANRAKSEFLANMSHELRTPMHGILSFSRFGIKRINNVSKEKLLHYYNQINKSGSKLLNLLNNLLDLSKLESGKADYHMAHGEILTVANSVIHEFGASLMEKGLNIETIPPRISTWTIFDPAKIEQVLRNLINNAIKFSSEGDHITICFNKCTLSEDLRKTDKRNTIPGITVAVKDQGLGIPEEELETIFHKFKQSSQTETGAGGTGLGLAICREIVYAHHGEIYAKKNPDGRGSMFVFSLPKKDTLV